MQLVVPSAVSAAVSAAIATRIITSQMFVFFIILSPIFNPCIIAVPYQGTLNLFHTLQFFTFLLFYL